MYYAWNETHKATYPRQSFSKKNELPQVGLNLRHYIKGYIDLLTHNLFSQLSRQSICSCVYACIWMGGCGEFPFLAVYTCINTVLSRDRSLMYIVPCLAPPDIYVFSCKYIYIYILYTKIIQYIVPWTLYLPPRRRHEWRRKWLLLEPESPELLLLLLPQQAMNLNSTSLICNKYIHVQ